MKKLKCVARGLGIYKDSFRELNTVGEALQGELGPGWQATGCPCILLSCNSALFPTVSHALWD